MFGAPTTKRLHQAGASTNTLYRTQLSPPEQNVDSGHHREVHICLYLVRHVGPETSTHHHVPAPPVRLLKCFADARSDRCEHLFFATVPDGGGVPDSGAR